MALFSHPQVVLLCTELDTTAGFYRALGFREVFRTPAEGPPIHVDLELDGYRIGLASESSTREDHDLDPVAHGQRAVVVLWSEDVERAWQRLRELGATPVREPYAWLGRLRIAWVLDPDGHLVQVAQATS